MGLGMETNSHLLGLIQETILSFEVVLSDGRLVKVTRDNEYSDLFAALPWSHGEASSPSFCLSVSRHDLISCLR